MDYNQLSNERKQLQKDKLLPEWYTTGGWQLMKANYLWAKTPVEQYRAIANAAARHVEGKMPLPLENGKHVYLSWYDAFFQLLWNGWLSPSTPVLSNMGNSDRGMPVSCSGGFIDDSIDSFYKCLHEGAILSKYGFGTSAYVGAIRPRGAPMMKGTGKASGPMPSIDMLSQMTNDVSQGCYDNETEILTEKGFISFEELIYLKEKGQILKVAQVNENNFIEFVEPLDYIKYNYTGEMIRVKDSKNIDLLLTPNHNMVYKTLERVSTKKDENGKYISNKKQLDPKWKTKSIEDMKFYRNIYMYHSAFKKEGEETLSDWDRFLIAYQADGSPCKNCKTAARFRFKKIRKYERLISILNNLNLEYSENFTKDNVYEIYVNTHNNLYKTLSWVKDKLSSVSSLWCEEFLKEVSNWDSSIVVNTEKLFSFSYSSLYKINIDILSTLSSLCGYKQKFKLITEREGNRNDLWHIYISNGDIFGCEKLTPEKEFYSNFVYCVEVPSHKLVVRRSGQTVVCGNSNRRGSIACYLEIDHPDFYEVLNNLEENPKRYNIGWNITEKFINRLDAGDEEALDRYQSALKVKLKTGKGYFCFIDKINKYKPEMYVKHDKIVKAQNLCAEITLFADNENTFTCVLSSMNLAKYDEWKDTNAIYIATVFLDCVASEFVKIAKEKDILHKAVKFTEENRALGLGLMGFSSLLSKRMIAFEELQAHLLNIEIAKSLKEESHRASKDMAEYLGEPLICKGFNRRNTHTMSLAPTKSTALIMGGVSESISPHIGMTYTQVTPAGEVDRVNPELVELMKSKNIFSKKHLQEVIERKGSVQEVSWLTDREKLVFRTAFEINQEVIIRYASMRQKYIDQGQSLNLYFAGNADEKEISRIHQLAFKDPNILSLYYIYSRKDTVVAKNEECIACT
jgi:ribonucleoside-diphosphate reductase alpha chain